MAVVVWASFIILSVTLNVKSENIYSNQIAVQIKGGPEKAREIAKRNACDFLGQIGSLEDHYLFEHSRISKRSLTDSSAAHQHLTDEPDVLWLEQQVIKPRVKRDLSDENELLPSHPISLSTRSQFVFKDPLYPRQWYMHKGAHGGFDMNVEKAWRRKYSGKGISVSILDDGLQPNHPDLMQNYDPMASLDINGKDNDPTPTDDGNNKHGTRCAGEVAAIAGNDLCGVGVAYNASIGGVRMLDGDVHDSVEATALSLNPQHIHIYSASWGPNDDGQTVDGPGPLAKRAFEDGIRYGRGGLGSIFVWASGNGGKSQDSCSCDGYTNSIYTISVSSAAQDGSKPWYLEECASTLATTYSSGSAMQPSIVTTDLNTPGNGMRPCTDRHTGTSASAPLAAGIIALALEANPKLTWRDLQHMTILSARPEPLLDDDWAVNGMGRKYSNKFGYGLMDADRLVQLAEKWQTVPEQRICHTEHFAQQIGIVKGRLSVDVTTDGCKSNPNAIRHLEHVQAVLTIDALHRGTIMARLTSPMGTVSTLLPFRLLDTNNQGFHEWPFMSVQFWGEDPAGKWRIEIFDSFKDPKHGSPTSYLLSWWLVLHGTEKEPVSGLPSETSAGPFLESAKTVIPASGISKVACHLSCASCHGPNFDDCNSCFRGYYIHNSQCLLSCPNGFFPVNDSMTCRSCSTKCIKCESVSSCMACQVGYILLNNQCIALHSTIDDECKQGFYFDHRLTKCKNCSSECATCMGPSAKECLSCVPPKVLFGQCLPECPVNFTVVDSSCVAGSLRQKANVNDGFGSSETHTYFLTAAIACIVIVSIGLVVFCCLQALSDESRSGSRIGSNGMKYEKAPLQPLDEVDESDEEVETFSKNKFADILHT